MSIFPNTTPAPVVKTKNVKVIATFYAVILVVMAVAQLFTFDEFLKLVSSFDFPGGIQYAHFIAAFVVVTEVFALPFLLRMPLSIAFRWFSMILGWLVALIWAKIAVWLVISDTLINNIGFLGTTVNVTPGWWAVFVSLAFGILAAWSSWGMWPGRMKTKRVVKPQK